MANGGGDGRTEGRMDGRTDGRTSQNSPLCSTGHRPFGAAAQKGKDILSESEQWGKERKRKTIMIDISTSITSIKKWTENPISHVSLCLV